MLSEWKNKMTRAFKLRTIVIALLVLVAGNILLTYVVLRPSQKSAEVLKRNMHQLELTFEQMKSTDMKAIADVLDEQVTFLKDRQRAFSHAPLTTEQIPLFISKLEQEANSAGLNISSTMRKKSASKKKKGKEIKAAAETVHLDLDYRGSFSQLISFLEKLSDWERGLLIKEINIKQQNGTTGFVSGRMTFVSRIEAG